MKKSYLLLFALFCLLSVDIHGQTNKGAYSFLDATNSARVAALGGVMLPIDDSDIQLGVFNPSLINNDLHNDIALSYVNYYAGINFFTGQYSRTFDKIGSYSATLQFHSYGDFKYADANGDLTGGSFSPSDFSFTVGWGRQLDPHWSIGANVKLCGIQYESFKTFALAADVAGSYKSNDGWMFSLAARNIGYELYSNFEGSRNKLPFKMTAGVAKRLEHLPFLFSIMYDNIQKWDLTFDDPLDLNNNTDPITGEKRSKSKIAQFGDNLMRHIVLGGELYIGKNLVLRMACNYGERQNMMTPTRKGLCGFSYGFGLKIWRLRIDYSRSEMHIFGSPNYITVSTNINRLLNNSF